MALRAPAAALLLLALALAGCTSAPEPAAAGTYAALGFDGTNWPRLEGVKLTVLAYSSFGSVFGDLARDFRNRTGAEVELVTEDDTGGVLERALREKGEPSFDVVYGVDNILLGKARREGLFEPYRALLARDIEPSLAFVEDGLATPMSHGYIAVNVDAKANLTLRTLDDVRANAGRFVTQDPRTSTPGLGFLIATVATYGDVSAGYDYLDYWKDLFEGGVLITAGWTEAYAGRFTGGYGQFESGARVDKAIVTSYTTSPAYEQYYGYDKLNHVVLAPKSTFHQVQTMAIAKGTPRLAAAQAFIEFCLTEAYQARAASGEAIYPVVRGVNVSDVYQGKDPRPGSFQTAGFTPAELDAKAEGWVRAWTEAYEKARAGA